MSLLRLSRKRYSIPDAGLMTISLGFCFFGLSSFNMSFSFVSLNSFYQDAKFSRNCLLKAGQSLITTVYGFTLPISFSYISIVSWTDSAVKSLLPCFKHLNAPPLASIALISSSAFFTGMAFPNSAFPVVLVFFSDSWICGWAYMIAVDEFLVFLSSNTLADSLVSILSWDPPKASIWNSLSVFP